MYALIQNGKVVATNEAGFGNAVLGQGDEVIQHVSPTIGYLWDGESFSADPVDTANIEREWRDSEMLATDAVMISDYPITVGNKAVYITYRLALRAYPQQEDFPNGERPVLGEVL